jgi:hypothetical protein
MYEYGTLKPVEVILRTGRETGKIVEGMIQTKDILYVHMEMSQLNPLYNYYILLKTFFSLKLINSNITMKPNYF